MLTIVGTFLAGLGLFFVGMKFLTSHLKALNSKKLRHQIAKWTGHPFMGLLWGGVTMTVTQSGAASLFILVSMLRSGLITVTNTLPVIIGTNMFAGLIVLVLTVDMRLGILYLLGLSGIVFNKAEIKPTTKSIAGALFGMGMLFLGLATMQDGVAPLAQSEMFEEVLKWTLGYYMVGFAIGLGLAVLVQSSVPVAVLAVVFQEAGIFTLWESIMIVYGSRVGTSLRAWMLSVGLEGESKQVSMYQTGYNFLGAVLLVPAFYAELWLDIPLIKAGAEWISADAGLQVALVYIIANAVPGIPLFFSLRGSTNLLARLWPETAEEQVAKPRYLHEHAIDDPESAIDLIELEQMRLFDSLSMSLASQRDDGDKRKLPSTVEAFDTLSAVIHDTMTELTAKQGLLKETCERLNCVLKIQSNLEGARAVTEDIAKDYVALRPIAAGAKFVHASVEGMDAVLLTVKDLVQERCPDDFQWVEQMTSNDGDGVKRVRSVYLGEESQLNNEVRMRLLSAANLTERFIWLLGDTASVVMASEAIQSECE